mmetsp:Transcript_14383/g.22182  ORF Transcript_14383/g.22182 Transcript_14383/m.22182 type:complete len:110 (-) Transcript_14383:745-1074(-)
MLQNNATQLASKTDIKAFLYFAIIFVWWENQEDGSVVGNELIPLLSRNEPEANPIASPKWRPPLGNDFTAFDAKCPTVKAVLYDSPSSVDRFLPILSNACIPPSSAIVT